MKRSKIIKDLFYINNFNPNEEITNLDILNLYQDNLDINNCYLYYKYENNKNYTRTIDYHTDWYFDGSITTESLNTGLYLSGYSNSLSNITELLPDVSLGSISPEIYDNLSIGVMKDDIYYSLCVFGVSENNSNFILLQIDGVDYILKHTNMLVAENLYIPIYSYILFNNIFQENKQYNVKIKYILYDDIQIDSSYIQTPIAYRINGEYLTTKNDIETIILNYDDTISNTIGGRTNFYIKYTNSNNYLNANMYIRNEYGGKNNTSLQLIDDKWFIFTEDILNKNYIMVHVILSEIVEVITIKPNRNNNIC